MREARIKGYVGIRRESTIDFERERSSIDPGPQPHSSKPISTMSASSSSEEAAVSASLFSENNNNNNNNNNNKDETDFVLNADGSILIDHKGVSRIVR